MIELSNDFETLKQQLIRLRGNPIVTPNSSVVIPVNAQTDLARVFEVLSDLGQYNGNKLVETILVVNNYTDRNAPGELQAYREVVSKVIAIPKIDRPNKNTSIPQAARIPGVQAAQSETILLFDADCRIPHATDLIDWYVSQFEKGVDLAYTHVDYFDLPAGVSTRVRMLIHHSSRWFRRTILGMPTSRGSNYAIRKKLMLELYAQGRIPQELSVGPVIKSIGGRIAYSGSKKLTVYTSGRFFSGGWKELFSYLIWRVGFYNRTFNLRSKAARSDQQEN